MSVNAVPWESGNPYEQFMGRWSRPVARKFLEWLSISEQKRWLDVGCGTGVLSGAILEMNAPLEVVAVDTSDTFIAYARKIYHDSRLRFEVGDSSKLPSQTGHFDSVVSGLALNFFPEPAVAMAEIVRSTRSGGLVAIYVWDYAGKMQMLRYFWDAVNALDPTAKEQDEGERFPLCQPSGLESLCVRAGLKHVELRAIDTPTIFADFDDYWTPFLGGQGPAPGYVSSLSDEQRHALEAQLRAVLPVRADGSIALIARAWAIRGRV